MTDSTVRSLSRQSAPIRLLAFVGALALLWLPIYWVVGRFLSDPNSVSIVSMTVLFVEFLALVRWWNRAVHGCDRPFQRYGLLWNAGNGVRFLQGLSIGVLSLFLLFMVQAGLGWVTWTFYPGQVNPGQVTVVLDGLLVAVGVALGEELVFRGWLLDELERDYSPSTTLWASSLTFAALHFIRPLTEIIRTFPQFPGLVGLGLLLVWAKRSRQGSLGIAIGLHAGLVWGYYMVNVGEWVEYTGTVSDWWSGVDHNPLAGGLGLGFLAILGFWFRWRAIVTNRLDASKCVKSERSIERL